jgi:hypothetical protein
MLSDDDFTPCPPWGKPYLTLAHILPILKDFF